MKIAKFHLSLETWARLIFQMREKRHSFQINNADVNKTCFLTYHYWPGGKKCTQGKTLKPIIQMNAE